MATGRATTRRVQWSTSIGRPLRARLAALVSLVLVALAFGGHGRADAPGDIANQDVLARRIEAAIANADLGEQVGVSVVNLRSGRSIVGHNATTVLNPASNMKLVTAAVAMLELGPHFKMRTGLYGRQKCDSVVGGLFMKGFGDPTLTSAEIIAMAQDLVRRGVKKVDEVVVDGSYFDGNILPPAFEQQPKEVAPFRAAVGAVSVNASAYRLRVRPGRAVGEPARAAVDGGFHFDIKNKMTTSAGGAPSVVAVQTPKDDKLVLHLSGSVPIGITGVSYRRRVESPLHYAGYILVEALRSLRVQVPARVKLGPRPRGAALLTHRSSPPLGGLLSALGKSSDNFVAEMVLKVLAAEKVGAPGRSEAGAKHAREVLRKLGITSNHLSIVNGSGLFDGNKLAPAHLTKLLKAVYDTPSIYPDYLAHLAVGGVDGTLRKRLKTLPSPRVVRAKTGTLAGTIALSGYVLGPTPDRVFAFSVLCNGVHGKHAAARGLADRIATDIALHLWAK